MKAILPKKVESLNVLNKWHWAKRGRHRKNWGQLVTLICKRTAREEVKRKVTITSYRKGTLDHDNLVGGCKPLMDALVAAGWLYDDAPEWVEVEYRQEYDKDERTEVEVV